MKRVLTVVGARPQFVKAGMVAKTLHRTTPKPFDHTLIHTGQHYDDLMSDVFFRELGIELPSNNLDVGSGETAEQTALMISRLDEYVRTSHPDIILAYGDTNSTLAAALVAAFNDVAFVHVEAGERIFRRRQVPEESNRVLADQIARLCLTATRTATENLLWEGFAEERVRFVGDPMYDLFLWGSAQVDRVPSTNPNPYGYPPGEYHLATIHRLQNASSPDDLTSLLTALDASALPVILPMHPRVAALLKASKWLPRNNLILSAPLGYFDFLRLLLDCKRVVTDSGGVTREAFFAGKPCVIPMGTSWWSEVVECGWAAEVGSDRELLLEQLDSLEPKTGRPVGLFGDGSASERIIEVVAATLETDLSREGPWHHLGRPDQLPPATHTNLTLDRYRHLLHQFTEKGYKFKALGDLDEGPEHDHHVVLMRHDIDLDTRPALDIARLENELGLMSTFFFLVRSDHYNLLSPVHAVNVQSILAMGHRIGLHFDCAAYPETYSIDQLARAARQEVALLEQWFENPVDAVTHHRPSPMVLEGDPGLSDPLPHG